MPGHTNKKQAQRTKGNVRPSSSSHAAQLLAGAGTAPTGFIGFGGFTGSPGYVPASQAFDDVDSSLDSDFRMVLRKLTKKDSTTKIKALQEFGTLCEEKDVELLKAVLPFWPRIYNKVAIDVDHKVRESTQQAMNTLVLRVRKNLAPYLKSLMGTWLLCQCDTYQTVATASLQAFQTAFPPAKQTDALVFCKSVICEFLIDNLLNQTPNSLSDPQTTEKEDMINKYNRVLTSSLLALRKLLTSLPTNQIEDLKEPLRTLLADGKFWKHGKSTILSVKSAMYTFLAGVCQTIPGVAQEFSKKLSPFILNSIDDKDPVVCPAVWEAVLSLVNFVQACWQDVSVEKSMWPKLRKLLENGCYGNSTLIGPDLLPFISKVPVDLLKDKYKIYTEFLCHMKLGLGKEELQSSTLEMSAFVKAYMECTHFVVKEISDPSVLSIVLNDQLLPVVASSVVEMTSVLNNSPLHGMLGSSLEKMENTENDNITSAMINYWSELADRIIERMDSEEEAVTMAIVGRVVTLVRSLVSPPISCKVEEKLGKMKLSASDENSLQKGRERNSLTKGMSLFIQRLTLYAFQSAHKHFNAPCLNLFASLMELNPAENTIKSVIESCHGDVETDQSHSNYFVFNVCLPWLQKIEADDQKHVISIICTFMAMLDNSSLTALLQTLTETIQNFECFHHFLSKCITLETSFNCIRNWLLSESLGNKLVSIAAVVCNESIKPGNEINTECGWDIISLVLTAEHNSDQVIQEDYIRRILQTIHNTLLSLRVNTDPNRADIAVRFVSKATHSFFFSSRSCLLPSAEDLLITLFTISLDNSYRITDETLAESESVWSSGFISIVKQTGGLIQDGRLLQKTVSVIKDKVITIETFEVFEKMMLAVKKLLLVVQDSLPDGRGDNPVMSELVHSLYILTENWVPTHVTYYYMLKGEITYLNIPLKTGTDLSFSKILFSTLFNIHLLCSVKVEPGKQGASPIKLDPEETKLLLSVTHHLNVLQQWKEMIKNVSLCHSLSTAMESLESSIKMMIQQLSSDYRKTLVSAALDKASDKGSLWTAVLRSILQIYSKDTDFTLDFNSLLDRCSDLDESKVQVLQVASQYITSGNRHTLSEIMVARMISSEPVTHVNGGIQALSVLNLVAMDTTIPENMKELLQTALSQILTWKDENEDLLLYACNISQSKPEVVLANIEMMKFLQLMVRSDSAMFTDKDWDFVMCSVVSFVQSIEESAEMLNDSILVQMFTCAACRLLSTVADCLQSEISSRKSFPPNLLTEWNEFFCEGIYGVLVPLFVKMTGKQQSLSSPMTVLLKSVSMAVCRCPKQQVLEHKLSPYLKTDDTSDLPDSLQTLLNHICPLMSHDSREVQLAAFYLLYSIIPDLPQYDKESKESDQEEVSRCPPQQFMSVIQNCYRLEDSLSGLDIEDCLKITPASEEYTTALSYLLTWRLLLCFFKNSTAEIRQEYAIYFRQTGLVYQLLSNVYRLMPETTTQSMFDKNFQLQVSDEANSRDLQCLACNVYRHTLQTVPAMVRQWWKEQDRKTINYVDKFTSKNVSQILCTEEIQPVNKTDSNLDNITIKTRPLTREVIATYALEEVTIEMVIALPENYPLGTITVVSEKRVGVSAAVWDKWLLQLNVFLQYQNGSIVDGLRIWKRNIDKRFEGVDDCMICFSVIHGTNYQLPRLTCKTCKKKFHSACLYKWFQTSHNSTCPLCRNLF